MTSAKLPLNKPTLIMLYGYPGSGKTHFARQLTESMQSAHVQGDRIRFELFEEPRYDKQENEVVSHLMEYMTEEFLNAGISVVFDTNAMRLVQRRALRDIARRNKAEHLLVWLQIDSESSLARCNRRDRRRIDDKYTQPLTQETFKQQVSYMQNPNNEDFVVISGKHTFSTQRGAVFKKLFDMGLIDADNAKTNVVKPELVNLIPHRSGRVDMSRRNIVIR